MNEQNKKHVITIVDLTSKTYEVRLDKHSVKKPKCNKWTQQIRNGEQFYALKSDLTQPLN